MAEPGQGGRVLDRLEALARQGSAAPGDAVLDLMVDLLQARGPFMRPGNRDACAGLLAVVMRRASPAARVEAAERLARLPGLPPGLLVALAREPIEVAGPVLQHGAGLSGMDLMRLVTELSPAHLRAVARRPTLGETVTDLLVLRGDREAVMLALLNRNARFSQTSLTTLADRAGSDGALRTALVQRSDLPDGIVERLWPLLDAGHKARLLASGWRYSMSEIEEVGRETGAALQAAVRDGTLPQGVDTYRALVEEGRVSLSEALDEVVGAGRLVEAAQLVARLNGLTEGVALNLLYGVYDRGLALLARRTGLDEAVLTGLACARARLPFIGGSDVRRTLRAREEIGDDEAREVLDLLDTLWWAGVSNGGTRRRFRG